ncbi:hypothetical protein SESBI_24238 [Sesbania bispinosa]|nr:hypothetical protein SESBI_24238 [Sesbania bispinosa]
MDLHALGISYKIKRLKQLFILVERLTGKQTNDENTEVSDDRKAGIKAYLSLTTLLNKQFGRYQSLQEKTDDLCKQMHENDLYANCGDMNASRTKEKTSTLEHSLKETFQLQRYLLQQKKNLWKFDPGGNANRGGIDMKRFAVSI